MPTITDLEFDEKLEELIALRRNSQSWLIRILPRKM
jgi:hypothetical protein